MSDERFHRKLLSNCVLILRVWTHTIMSNGISLKIKRKSSAATDDSYHSKGKSDLFLQNKSKKMSLVLEKDMQLDMSYSLKLFHCFHHSASSICLNVFAGAIWWKGTLIGHAKSTLNHRKN